MMRKDRQGRFGQFRYGWIDVTVQLVGWASLLGAMHYLSTGNTGKHPQLMSDRTATITPVSANSGAPVDNKVTPIVGALTPDVNSRK